MLRTATTTVLLAALTTGGGTRPARAQSAHPDTPQTTPGTSLSTILPALDTDAAVAGRASTAPQCFATPVVMPDVSPTEALLAAGSRPGRGRLPSLGAPPVPPTAAGPGAASAGQGDPVHRLVIPEPATLLLAALGLSLGRPRRRSRPNSPRT